MTRVKRGTISLKRRRNILSQVKGYRFGRKSKEKMAKEAIAHAGVHAFQHRRKKKGVFRRLWQIKINAASRANGITYSKMTDKLKKENIALDRKILADLAENRPEVFSNLIEKIK
ncbi:MAG: 50S ribosomal protein L20 [bacterium]|nr:50S ribosomal protein L20 [bacterium]